MSYTIKEMIKNLDKGVWKSATNLKFENKGTYLTKGDYVTYVLWKEGSNYKIKVGEFNIDVLSTLGLKDGWVEYNSQILDVEERVYLDCALRPFKNRVKSISKVNSVEGFSFSSKDAFLFDTDTSRIKVSFKDSDEIFYFPSFKSKTMYKGMKPFKEYTLRDLGLHVTLKPVFKIYEKEIEEK